MNGHEKWLREHPKQTRRGGRPKIPIEPGARFGMLVVVSATTPSKRRSRSVCRCDCGNVVVKVNHDLKNGTRSCGCLSHTTKLVHGGCARRHRERLFNIWSGMKSRCYNPNSKIFKHYGGRGIRICEEWLNDYAAFRGWALSHGYDKGKSIDRINNDGNYEPSNCRWATAKEQCLNRRSSVRIEIDGNSKTILEWCSIFGTPENLARSRIGEGKKGIDIFLPNTRTKGGAK